MYVHIIIRWYFAGIRRDELLKITEKMRKHEYLDILRCHQKAALLINPSLPQNNDPTHTAKVS